MESGDSQLHPCSGYNWGQWLALPMVMEQGEIDSGRGRTGTTHCPALAYIKRSSRPQGVTACGLPLLGRGAGPQGACVEPAEHLPPGCCRKLYWNRCWSTKTYGCPQGRGTLSPKSCPYGYTRSPWRTPVVSVVQHQGICFISFSGAGYSCSATLNRVLYKNNTMAKEP